MPKKNCRLLFNYTGKPYTTAKSQDPAATPDAAPVLKRAAAAWLSVLKAAGRPMDRDECLTALAALPADEIGTSQKPIRIIYYWKKALVTGGFLEISQKPRPARAEAPAAEAPAAEAPAAEAPAAATA